MRVFAKAEHLITGLGFTPEDNFEMLRKGSRGLSRREIPERDQVCWVSKVDRDAFVEYTAQLRFTDNYTWLEQLLLSSIEMAVRKSGIDISDPGVIVILASTKGNIDLLDRTDAYSPAHSIHLTNTGRCVAEYFGLDKVPFVLSNACTSGLMAVSMGARFLEEGAYRHAVVAGVDVLSEFTLLGFQALGALDPDPCRPYDSARSGINLGEASGAIILSIEQDDADIVITGTGNSNDANHISGPSRTGSGLIQATRLAMEEAGIEKVDAINAHGTATLYNDEMEAQAFHALGMSRIPIHSSKGYWGHTLGAAGVIELISLMQCMRNNAFYGSVGYSDHGLTLPLNIAKETMNLSLDRCLKTSSGFGGSNSALVIEKV